MMRSRGTVSSVRQPSAWLIAGGGLALYGALVFALVVVGAWPRLPLPWWVAQAAPPIVYGVLVRLCVRRVPASRWIAATVSLWVIHVALGVLTGAAAARFGSSAVDFGGAGAFPPPLPALFWVPLLLVPLRDAIGGGGRMRRGLRARDGERGVTHDGRPLAPVPARPAAVGATRPAVVTAASAGAPSSASVMTGAGVTPRALREARAHPVTLDRGGPAGERAAPRHAAPDAVGVGAAVEPPPHRLLDEMLASETSAAVVRVSFDRIAGQLPAGAFHLPLDRLAASLPEPGYLLIPQRLVLAQLAEGLVRAGWEVVGKQFPRHVLAMTDEELTRQLPDGQLVLPLDELVPQLPLELFVPAGPVVDIEGIESFPAPFQPALAEEGVEEPAGAFALDPPPVAETQSASGPPGPRAGCSVDEEPETPREQEIPELEDVELDPALTGMVEVEAGDPSGVPPGWESVTATTPPPAALPQPSVTEPEQSPDEIAMLRRVAALLAPLKALDVRVESVGGVKLFTVSSLGPCAGQAVAAARLVLPLLAEGHAPWAVEQMTLRGPDAAVVLTPLGPVGQSGSVLVSAVPRGGTLALLEILCLRAVAGCASDVSPRVGPDPAVERQEPDLLDSEPPTRVHQIAATLGAIGPVIAGALRDGEGERDLYLFLPAGTDVRMVGSFAAELDRAMRKAADSGHRFHTAVLRCGTRRLIIRREDAATERSRIVVAGGETERPGLAYRQVEAAALILGAR